MAKRVSELARMQIIFWSKVAIMIDAGSPISKAVDAALKSTQDADLQQAMNMWVMENQGRDEFEGTTPLSEALDAFPDFFPPFLITAVRTAEETRTRQNIFRLIVDYLEKEAQYGK